MKKIVFSAVTLTLFLCAPAPAQTSEADRDLRFADRLYDREEWDLAISQYRVFLEKFPSDPRGPDARYRLADALFRKGNLDEARGEFRGLLEVTTDADRSARVQARLGEIAFRKNETAEAQSILSALLEQQLKPEVEESARFFLAKNYQAAGELDQAAAQLDLLLGKFPTGRYAPFATVTLAEIEQKQGKKAEAAATLREFAEKNLGAEDEQTRKLAQEALIGAGQIMVELDNQEEAAAIFQRFAEVFPDSPKVVDALYGEARAYHKLDQCDRVLPVVDQLIPALEREGRDDLRISARFLRATCLFNLGKHEEALDEFELVLGLDEPAKVAAELHPIAAGQVVQCLYLLGRYDDLLENAGEYETRFTGNTDLEGRLLYFKGRALAEKGRHGEAIVEFASLLSNYPNHPLAPAAMFQIGRSCLLDGRYERAAKNLITYVEKYPDDPEAPDALYFAAESYYRMQNFQAAAEQFRRLVEDYPDSARRKTAFLRWGESNVHLENYDEVEKVFTRFLEAYPEGPDAAEAWYYRGFVLQKRKDYTAAIECYNEVLDKHAGSEYAANARLRKGLAQYQAGSQDAAVETFLGLVRDASSSQTLDSSIFLWVGQFLVSQNRCSEAIEVYEKAADQFRTLDQVRETSFYARAECHRRLHECSEAVALYDKLIDLYPGSAFYYSAQYGLGMCLQETGEWAKASSAFAEALATTDNVLAASATFHYAESLEEQGNYNDAYTSYMKVALLFASEDLSPRAFLGMAECQEELGDAKKAREAYRELMEAYPNSPQAAIAREKIGSASP